MDKQLIKLSDLKRLQVELQSKLDSIKKDKIEQLEKKKSTVKTVLFLVELMNIFKHKK